MLTSWGPEHGFVDDPKPEQGDELFYQPLIVHNVEEDTVAFNWEQLKDGLKEQCEKAERWFPDQLLETNWMFPLPLYSKENPKHTEFKQAWYNKDVIVRTKEFILSNHLVPFLMPTPAFFSMMFYGKHPAYVLSTEVAREYLIAVFNMSPMHGLAAPGQQPREIIDLIMQVGDKESNPVAQAFFNNTMNCGMMQHYFMDDRHASAPDALCRILVQYTLRTLQVIERQMLRLSPLFYVKEESARATMSTRTLAELTETQRAQVTKASVQLYKLQFDESEYYAKSENQPKEMPAPPSAEQVAECTDFHAGLNLAYAECALWYLQASQRFPAPLEIASE